MSETIVTEHNEMHPGFDLEGFMEMCHETRIGGATLETLATLWEEWDRKFRIAEINTGKISYLAVWLPQDVEERVDTLWGASASDGFLANTLAQYMCMTAVKDMIPEVEGSECAPSPRPTPALREALENLGVPYKGPESSLLSLRYAVVTHYPFRGGCEICHLQEMCPKGQGKGESAGFVLPGYERGKDEAG